jgi:hypothetical protein
LTPRAPDPGRRAGVRKAEFVELPHFPIVNNPYFMQTLRFLVSDFQGFAFVLLFHIVLLYLDKFSSVKGYVQLCLGKFKVLFGYFLDSL